MVPYECYTAQWETTLRVLNTIAQDNLNAVAAAAQKAEADGYSGISTLENRHDPFLPLAIAATQTEKLELSTGVAIAFLRSPMSVANIAWDLQNASGGRFVLGLGTQIRAHNEKRFSVPWGPPVPRLREYVQALRAIWRAWCHEEKLNFEGEHYRFSLMPPNFIPEALPCPPPPVTIAAVGPAMLRLAGEVADGVRLHPFCTRQYIEQTVMPCLEAGFARSGRDRRNFEINGGGFIATGPDNATVAKQRAWVRQRIGFYGSTPAYWPVLESAGFSELGPRLNALTKQGAWDQLAGEIPDDLLDACAVSGRHDEIAALIKARFGDLCDTVQASASSEQPAGFPGDLLSELSTIKTPFSGFFPAADAAA